jgi:death-on-curing protein
VAETIEAHRLLIEEFGGKPGIRDRGLLESAVLRPQSGYYNNPLEEASALMESLTKNHPFLDGNKRIGFAMADAMLRANGYYLDVDVAVAHCFIIGSLEKSEFHFDRILEWLSSHIKEL